MSKVVCFERVMIPLARLFIVLGLIFLVLGGLFYLLNQFGLVGRLPGDIRIERGNVTCVFPLAASILLSILLTLILNLFLRLIKP